MTRFFVLADQIRAGLITLMGRDVRHIQRVLRLGVGDHIECLDGQGYVYKVKLTHVEAEHVVGEIVDSYKADSEPDLQVTIAQGIPKGERWDFVLQKCSEVGATVFQPLFTERTIVNIASEQLPHKMERWQKIVQEAAEQSQRSVAPRVLAPMTLKDWLQNLSEFELVIVAWENEEEESLRQILDEAPDLKRLAIIVGPEGGFSSAEIDLIKQVGGRTVSIGPRILRSETASVVLLSLALYHYGDMGER